MPSEGAIILGSLAAFFFCMMFVSAGLKYYFKKKAEEDEANAKVESTWSPSSSSPGPAAASDVLSERDKLIQGTSGKVGAKPIQVAEADINVVSPPSIPNPFTINTANDGDKSIDYTITFDIKVEKTLGREEVFTVLDRGGVGDDGNGQRPVIQLKSKATEDFTCTTTYSSKNLCPSGQRRTYYRDYENNSIIFTHKPSLTLNTSVGPQAGQDFKNLTIVVKTTNANRSTVKMFWDGTAVGGASDSAGADWGNLASSWRWAGGQTAVNAIIGAVKVKNAYIFGRALDDDEVAVLLGRGASATSTYAAEPKLASWKFNPSGYESD
jgi:hypothetical protein